MNELQVMYLKLRLLNFADLIRLIGCLFVAITYNYNIAIIYIAQHG